MSMAPPAETDAAPLLTYRGLTVPLPSGADRQNAVEDLTLDIRRNEVLCLVGESGSGKSVTALATMGLLKPPFGKVGGQILFEGTDMTGLPTAQRRRILGTRMSMVFQEPMSSLNPFYKAGAQVSETLRIHTDLSAAEIRARVLALFDEVRLPDPERIWNAYPHELSGGQCQRVMIASALALDPALLIADEPTTALDVTTQAQILNLILTMRERHGSGVLFITHDFGVVSEIADRVGVMRHGRLVELGTKDEVFGAPSHPYTRQLLDAVPRLAPRRARPNDREVVLRAEGVSKTYSPSGWLRTTGKEVRALKDASLTIRRGETVGIVGESGSGKSTFSQCILRLVEPTAGRIEIAGSDFLALRGRALRAKRRQVQIIFQDPFSALDPRQRIGDAIAEGPIIQGAGSAEAARRSRDLLEAVGLEAASAERFPHEFSGGQRQRICIARALALEPDLLVADESVSALDVSVQAQILRLLADIQERLGFGLMFVTHDLRVASQICDRICVMQQGRIVETGEPHQIFSDARETYTRALLSAVPGQAERFGQVEAVPAGAAV